MSSPQIRIRIYKLLGGLLRNEIIFKATVNFISAEWGNFGEEFYRKHAPTMQYLAMAEKEDGEIVGIATAGEKDIGNQKVIYWEFTVVKEGYRRLGVGKKLQVKLMGSIFFSRWYLWFFKPMEVWTLTPNLQVYYQIYKYASFIYPKVNSKNDNQVRIIPADNETWEMAKTLILNSDNPDRYIDRNGLVLHGSYSSLTELIYSKDTAPWTNSDTINNFGDALLQYSKQAGYELIVRAKFNLVSALRILCHLPRTLA